MRRHRRGVGRIAAWRPPLDRPATTGAEDRVEAVGLQVAQALGRSSRTPARTCLVCRRRPSVIPAEVATFATIEDACQARLFDEARFGSGWAPAPLVVQGSRRLVALP
jgi:hypothetical protein